MLATSGKMGKHDEEAPPHWPRRRGEAHSLVTEWKPFRNPDFELMKKAMRTPLIFDGRNQYDPKQVAALGFEYFGIGR